MTDYWGSIGRAIFGPTPSLPEFKAQAGEAIGVPPRNRARPPAPQGPAPSMTIPPRPDQFGGGGQPDWNAVQPIRFPGQQIPNAFGQSFEGYEREPKPEFERDAQAYSKGIAGARLGWQPPRDVPSMTYGAPAPLTLGEDDYGGVPKMVGVNNELIRDWKDGVTNKVETPWWGELPPRGVTPNAPAEQLPEVRVPNSPARQAAPAMPPLPPPRPEFAPAPQQAQASQAYQYLDENGRAVWGTRSAGVDHENGYGWSGVNPEQIRGLLG